VSKRATRAWARGDGVTLRIATPDDLMGDDVQRALRDGIERGYEGTLPAAPEESEWYAIDAQGSLVGVLALRSAFPDSAAATLHALAIVVAQRGHAYGARALFALERRLARDGVRAYYARVPRTNGRGLYFMLRCGYAPTSPQADDGATWFRRDGPPRSGRAPRARAGAAGARRGERSRADGSATDARPSHAPNSSAATISTRGQRRRAGGSEAGGGSARERTAVRAGAAGIGAPGRRRRLVATGYSMRR
jgi:hypothetical protein